MSQFGGGRIRVLLVDDSAVARLVLHAIFETDSAFEVVGEAAHGLEAIALTERLRPDLITMDLEMPLMNGPDAIEEIMVRCATPILVVSSLVTAQSAYAAIMRGAVDVAHKPEPDSLDMAEFLEKARLVSRIPAICRGRLAKKTDPQDPSPCPLKPTASPGVQAMPDELPVFAIACSTGGPQALAYILARLPRSFGSTILIAQHISDGFAAGMVDWLATLSGLPIHLARAGEVIKPATIYLSPSESHLVALPNGYLGLQERGEKDIFHPSCDALLSSVAAIYGIHSVGIILSGMGDDGVKGMEKIFNAGGRTLAQDEFSSVIFGMNRIAIEKRVVQRVLSLEDLPKVMLAMAQNRADTHAVQPLDTVLSRPCP